MSKESSGEVLCLKLEDRLAEEKKDLVLRARELRKKSNDARSPDPLPYIELVVEISRIKLPKEVECAGCKEPFLPVTEKGEGKYQTFEVTDRGGKGYSSFLCGPGCLSDWSGRQK